MANQKILTQEEEDKLRQPIEEHVAAIQKKIDALRRDGTDVVVELTNHITLVKEDKNYTKDEQTKLIAEDRKNLEPAKAIEEKNKPEVDRLIAEAEKYLEEHFDSDYYSKVVASCEAQKEKAVYKNRQFDASMVRDRELQEIKDRQHEAFTYKYHLIDLLRMSKFTFSQNQAQKRENRKYTFNRRQFFLQNGLYIVIVAIFIFLCIITPIVKHTQLLTVSNILNILQQASPRMFFALGVAGLILLTDTDLSIGRMIGMSMVTATIVMHQGVNTGAVFGHIFDTTGIPNGARAILALLLCIIFCTCFSSLAGFFMARFKMHPFISTMSNMLIIFGLVTYATKGVSFGAIEQSIPKMFIPKLGTFPTIILWAVAAVAIVWFIWNKTTFGKNLYAVGGNPEAASVSGISVFKVTLGAFIMAGILYGCGAWLECLRMVGSGSAAYGQGWDMDAIAACVVGGVSFTGGIGKISGVVVGVLIFTSLTYSLTILGIDTNLQFVFEGIIILTAVTLDCLKYVQKK